MSKKSNKWFSILNSASSKEAEILIYGVIGKSYWDEDSVGASEFVKEFKILEQSNDLIKIRINSPGGSVWEGLPIYNAIKQSSKAVHTYIDGIAYSMGGVIALAGSKVFIAKNGRIMIHAASSFAYGNAKSFKKESETLESYDRSLSENFAERLNITSEEVRAKYFDYEDHYFTATEAKEAGLVDEIVDFTAEIPEDIDRLDLESIFNHYLDEKSNETGLFQNAFAKLFGIKKNKVVIPVINKDENPATTIVQLISSLDAPGKANQIANFNKILAEAGLIVVNSSAIVEHEETSNLLTQVIDLFGFEEDHITYENPILTAVEAFVNESVDNVKSLNSLNNAISESQETIKDLTAERDRLLESIDDKPEIPKLGKSIKQKTGTNNWGQMAHHQLADKILNSKI